MSNNHKKERKNMNFPSFSNCFPKRNKSFHTKRAFSEKNVLPVVGMAEGRSGWRATRRAPRSAQLTLSD
jgi:hypothetical protein